MKVSAIIPAAGKGTRLEPLTHTIPKPLLSVAGKPILHHIVEVLKGVGIEDMTFIIGYFGEKVKEDISNNFGDEVNCSFCYQDEPKGIAHAISLARDTASSGPTLIVLGDTVFDADISTVINGDYSSIGVWEVSDPRRFGVVELEGDFITDLVEKPEKPKSNLVIAGVYFIKEIEDLYSAIDGLIDEGIKTKGEYQITDALKMMIDGGEKITTFPIEYWYDCGKPETLIKTNNQLLKRDGGYNFGDMKNSVIIEPVAIAEGVEIEDSVIGPDVTICRNADVSNSIIRSSIIGENATIMRAALTRSIIGQGAVVEGRFTQMNVGDSSYLHMGRSEVRRED